MTTNIFKVPRFDKGQLVGFIGGAGIVKTYQLEAGDWNYLVEMEMGPLPEMGRIGSETMIWLTEADVFDMNEQRQQPFAIA